MTSKGVSPVIATVLLMGIAIASVSSAAVFLQGTMDSLQGNVEDWLAQEDRQRGSSIAVDYGYNGTDGSLLVDIRNDGSRTVTIEADDDPFINMYLDGKPRDWQYISGSTYVSSSEVKLDPSSVLTINTTVAFPSDGSSAQVEFAGPFGMQASYACFSQNGRCEA